MGMSLPGAPAPVSPLTLAMIHGTTARTCTDGLVEYPGEDGPDWFACHGCAGCTPATVRQTAPPTAARRAANLADVFADIDDEQW